MTHKHAICVGLIALGVAAATEAQAQYYGYGPPRIYAPPPGYYDGGLPPGEILMMVRAQGLTPLTQPARRGFRYVLLASDRMGGQLRVVVNADNGRIIRAMPAYDPRFAYHPARPQAVVPVQPQYAPPPPVRHGAAPPEVKDPPPVARAPRRTPPAQTGAANDQVASVPSTTESVPSRASTESAPRRTTRTPLPRPRPANAQQAAAEPAPSHETVASNPPAAQPPAAAATPAPAPAQKKAAPARTPTPLVPVAPLE